MPEASDASKCAQVPSNDLKRPALRHFGPSIFSVACVLLFIRLTVRDAVPVVAALYYAGQPILLSLLFLLSAGVWSSRSRRKLLWKVTGVVLAFCVIPLWLTDSFRSSPAVHHPKYYTAMTWNVMNGRLGWRSVFETIRKLDPHIVILVEAHDLLEEAGNLRTELLPEYRMSAADSGLCVLTKGEIFDDELHRLEGGGRLRETTISLYGTRVRVFGVDILSNPLRSRRTPIESLAARMSEVREIPLIVAGDFNTPPDSVHYRNLRHYAMHAFETVGDGYGPTWPSVAPILLLDQFWINAKVAALRCRAEWSISSDHRPVVLTFLLSKR